MNKTLVMKLLDKLKIEYIPYFYDEEKGIDAVAVASLINKDSKQVFKTLITVGKSRNFYCFVIPSEKSLSFKKASVIVGEKSLEMVHQKDLLNLTGYVHGGCSPIGLKKSFTTVIDISCSNFDTICISGGKRGVNIEISLKELQKVIHFNLASICE